MARIVSKSVQTRNSVSSRGQETSLGLKINIPGIQFGQKILNGGYGTVYRGYDITSKRDVAIKVSFNTLKNEYEIMVKLQNIPGIPKVYQYGQVGNSHFIIMELLFHDLQELRFSKSVYTAKTILLIGIQIITILKQIHQKEIIHRDIKPSNIMAKNMSTDGQLYLIDYGISQIINQPVNKTMGTILYDPISVHYQQVYSYIDDLEMLGYTLTYLYKGQLPWANQMIQMNREEKVGRMKQDFLSSRYMNELPFSELFGYIKLFDRTKKPDYDFLLMLFRQMLRRNNLKEDYIYDWTKQFKTGTCVIGRHRLTDFNTEFYETDIYEEESVPPRDQYQKLQHNLYKFINK
ncbi:hypothetical protein pb186bvf_018048 [Paramecium bursaria]